jgi:hypothetical protein
MTLDDSDLRVGPLTLAERAQVGEEYFRSCFTYALVAAVALSGVAVILGYSDGQPGAGAATAALAVLAGAAAAVAVRVSGGYERLRRYPYALAGVGPLIALVCLWHRIDANALYFPALAPLALAPCVAQDRRQQMTVIVSLAAGTCLGALEDTSLPRLQEAGELASSTIAVVVIGLLLAILIDWWARKVLLAPDYIQQTSGRAEAEPQRPPQASEAEPASAKLERIGRIARAGPQAFVELDIEGMEKLTGRHLQLLYLIREGLSQRDVAMHLCLADATVRRQVDAIRSRLQLVSSGTATASVASQLPALPTGFPDHREQRSPSAGGLEDAVRAEHGDE